MQSSKKIKKTQVEPIVSSDVTGALGYIPENVSNKQNSLATDGTGTKYPTVDAVNAALAGGGGGSTPDATTTVKGKLKLAGDLSGTADLPTVPALTTKENTSNKTTTLSGNETSTTLYPNIKGIIDWISNTLISFIGSKSSIVDQDTIVIGDSTDSDKTKKISWQNVKATLKTYFDTLYLSVANIKTIEGQSIVGTGNIDLTKSDVGLGNVDNTSDLNKPISTATQAALDLKANLEVRVPVSNANYTITGTGNQLIAYTSITATPAVPVDRLVTLPPATTANQRIWVTDESGLASNARRILVAPFAGDNIGGDSFAVINFPNGSGYFESDGAGKWNIISTTAIQFSAGINTAPTITDNGNGTVTIGTGVYALFSNTNGVGRPKGYQVAGGTFTLVNNSTNFIYVEYNTTTGVLSLQQTTTETSINDLTQVLVYAAYRQGTTLHPRTFDSWGIALSNKLNRSIYRTQRVRIEEGGILLGESASPAARTITISAGTAWIAAAENTLSALTSAANTCYHVFHVAGVYQTTTTVTQYNNTQYDDGTGLQTLTNGRYAVNWVYRSIGSDNDMAIVLGNGDFTLGQAQTSSKPSNIPSFLRHMELIGRIIVQKNAATATQIDNVSTTSFSSAGVTDHESLNNLQGGAANEHYHLTLSQYNNLRLVGRTTFSNANYTVLSTDIYVAQTGTMSAARTVTLPLASSVSPGYPIIIGDESGTVSLTNFITIQRSGSDTIDGATAITMEGAYAQRILFSDGVSKWSYDGGIARLTTAQTLINKAILPRVTTVAYSSLTSGQLTPNLDTTDVLEVTGISGTLSILNPTGTKNNRKTILLILKDDGTSRSIVTSSDYVATYQAPLPTATPANQEYRVGLRVNTLTGKLDVEVS